MQTRMYINCKLEKGAIISLNKDQFNYLGNVLRKHNDDKVLVFNGISGEWKASINYRGKRSIDLLIEEKILEQVIVPDVMLCFSNIRKNRVSFIIEKGTELGVRTFQPIISEHTQSTSFNILKAKYQSVQAAEQTQRLDIPEIMQPKSLLELLGDWDNNRVLLFADEKKAVISPVDVIANISSPVGILIGPEGGFSSVERNYLMSKNFTRPISLGPRVLRSDTASLSLLTLYQAISGDWN
ncbi:16S rRNA (uracil(1498)-N(3))-methyltransferase [Hellea sp.]|nr:16S rRNA (uracil(1498)-N(3))-methyltransferase [Hellea sp.]